VDSLIVMTHDEHRCRQRVILDQALSILRQDPSVLGVALHGSCAAGREDAFSDIDLACYLKDEHLAGRERLYPAVANIAPLLCDLWLWDVHALYLFEDGVRLDLDFHPPGALAKHPWIAKAKILHDPTGVLARTAMEHKFEPEKVSKPGEPVEWFFWMFRQILCWTKRGEQGDIRAYDKLAGAIDSLAQVRATLQRMRLWTLGQHGFLRQADPQMAEHLAASYPSLAAADIIRCTRIVLSEFERIGPDYCRKAGLEFPARKVEIMRRLFDEFSAIS
jgi:predicted nucleotidyltransferase